MFDHVPEQRERWIRVRGPFWLSHVEYSHWRTSTGLPFKSFGAEAISSLGCAFIMISFENLVVTDSSK